MHAILHLKEVFLCLHPMLPGLRRQPPKETPQRHSAGKFSINEDWLAVITGLVLLTLALTGIIPPGVIQ
jgi:hypothetical protein